MQRKYCTQKCLAELTRGPPLDKNCPNVKRHPRRKGKHAIDLAKFIELVQRQLGECVDRNCEPLNLRGALFKIRLVSHDYVFVGKGTVYAFVLHEGCIYERLELLQGTAIPIHLGNIDLIEKYYLDLGVVIRHMLSMS